MTNLPSPALLHLASEVDPTHAQRFAEWCDHHHGEMLDVEGVLRARRYELDTSRPRAGAPAMLLTLYDLTGTEVLDSAPYRRHTEGQTPIPDDIVPSLRFTRLVCARGHSVPDQLDDAAPAGRVLLHDLCRAPEDAPAQRAAAAQPDHARQAEVPTPRDPAAWHDATIIPAVVAAGGDGVVVHHFRCADQGASVVLCELDDARTAEVIAESLPAAPAALEASRGIYHRVFSATA